MNDRDLEKAWGKATDALEEIRQELQAIDAERSDFKERREAIMISRPFGRLEADAVLEHFHHRMQPVIEKFKRQAMVAQEYYLQLQDRRKESPASKALREDW